MHAGEFPDSALVLFGHGTTLNAESSAALLQHVEQLQRRRVFAEVREAFWKQEPQLQTVPFQLTYPRIYLVPFFISEGYFSEQVIPAALGFPVEQGKVLNRRLVRGSQTWFYCRPVGTHDSMASVLLDRAGSVVARSPFPHAPKPQETTLFLAGHGTCQNQNSRVAVERQAERIRAMGLYAAVHSIFLEEEPRIGQCYELANTRYLVVVPFFAGDGLHVQEDIPVFLGEPEPVVHSRLQAGKPAWRNPTEKKGKLVWYAPSVGTDPLMTEVILARVREIIP